MNKDAFVEKWKKVIGGGFLFGYHDSRTLTPSEQAEKAWKIAPEVERLLGMIYEDLNPQPKGAK